MNGVTTAMRTERLRAASPKARGPGVVALATLAFLALATLAAFAAFTFPQLTGRVVDEANILPAATRAAITTKLADLEDKSGIQLVVATVPSLQGSDIETFANQLFRTWKLGEAKKNNGLLFLIAPNDRKARIEVGYGLEGTMTDALSSVIMRTAIVPKFKAGDYAAGATAGVDAIIGALTVDAAEWQAKAKAPVAQQDPFDQILPFIVFLIFLFVFISMIRNARGQSGRWVRRGNRTIYIPPSSGSWGGGWSSGSGGGSSGGGFSGGGGSSGGGGASGSW